MEKTGQTANRYYTGKPCKNGHVDYRMKSNRLCVECLRVRKRIWKKHNVDKKSKHEKNAVYKRKYGITVDQYNELYQRQEGKCLICNEFETSIYKGKSRLLAIDHDHKTGKFRGLLCSGCNMGLGSFKDNADLLWKARKYLKLHK
jgi:hypothetical protein